MGKGLVDTLKKEFDIKDTWVSYEIHPETPREGKPLNQLFPEAQLDQMEASLRQAGQPYGLEFGKRDIIANTRLALEASEYARDHGSFDAFHEAIFKAYFERGENIGDEPLLLNIAESCGLDQSGLKKALDTHAYTSKLDAGLEEGQYYQVTGTPTFIINNKFKVVGAQPLESFRKALKTIQNQNN